jgi:hypothetical protein
VRALACLSVENGYFLRSGLEGIDEPVDLVHGCFASLRRNKLGNESVTILFEILNSLFDLS